MAMGRAPLAPHLAGRPGDGGRVGQREAGKRSSHASSSATRSSVGEGEPRHRWIPRPNAACRLTSRSITTRSASANTSGSRLAAGNDSRTSRRPHGAAVPVHVLLTNRAIVTGA